MKTLLSALLLTVGLFPALHAQAPAQPPTGPTMEVTKAWLESDGRALMRVRRLQTDRQHFTVTTSTDQVDTLTLNDCTLVWRAIHSGSLTTVTGRGSQAKPLKTRTSDVILALRDLSLGGITVEPDTLLSDTPVYAVRLVIRQPERSSSTQSTDFGNPEAIRYASLPVQTAQDGERIASAIKWAAGLCGVTSSSVF